MRQRAAQATVESAPDGAARPIAETRSLYGWAPLGSRLGPNDRPGRSPDAPPTGDDQSAVPPLFRGGYRLTRLVDLHHDTVITDREVDLPALQRLQLIHEVFRDRDHLSILGRPDGFSDHHHSGTVRLGDLEHHPREMPRTDRQLVVIRTGESVGICHLVPSRLALFRTYPAADTLRGSSSDLVGLSSLALVQDAYRL